MKKNVKALILSLLATLAIGSLSACDLLGLGGSGTSDLTSDSSIGNVEDEVTISLVETESVMRFATVQLNAVVKGTQDKPTWTTSDATVATVDENGLVSALTVGSAVITATIGEVSASCTVSVVETDIPHEIEVSLEEVSVFEGKNSEELTVDVSYDGEIVDGEFEYVWSLVEGDEDVVSITTSDNGKSAVFAGLKTGTVTYEIYTVARGYETSKEITITVKENTYALGISHQDIVAVGNGYAVDLTLGDEATDRVTFGNAYLAINGAPSTESVVVAWTVNNDLATYADGTIVAQKAGTAVLTGTAEYNGKALSLLLTVNIVKGQETIDDTDVIETAATKTFTVPNSVEKGEVEKIYFGDCVVFDKAAGKGSINGNVVTLDVAGMPAKDEDLGLGKELTIETNLIVYTMTVDLYTMIIDSVEELDMWQEVAAENAVRAGVCIEAQKGLAYNGYFVLGANIEYNKVWTPYKKFGELWALCYQNQGIWKDLSSYANGKAPEAGNMVDGAIVEDWGAGREAGFKGIFDGQGYAINGLSTADNGDYNAFIVTLGGGIVRNVAFTNVTIGSVCGSVVDRGNGTMENVYVEVASIASGKDANNRTWGLIRGGNNPKHVINNTIIDYTKANLSNLENVYLGCDITSEILTGVYVIGVPADYKGDVWNHEGVGRHQIGVFETYAELFADEANKLLINEWNKTMWEVGDNYVVAKAVKSSLGGNFSITTTESKVPAGDAIKLTTDNLAQYIVYTLKDAVDGVAIKGNEVSVAQSVAVGTTFTVVATFPVNGTSVEKTFTVDKPFDKVTAENAVNVDLGVYLDGTTVMVGEYATVDLSEIYETYLLGKSITVKYGNTIVYSGDIKGATWSMPLDAFSVTSHGASSLVFSFTTEELNCEITLPINFIQTEIELNNTNVTNPSTLQAILNSNPYGNYVLTSDLNLGGKGLKVVDFFGGVLDGQGYVIKNTYLHHDSDTNGYNPQWIKESTGTIKNIGFNLDYFTYVSGGRSRGLVSINNGTIENVYVNVTLNQVIQASQTDTTYFNSGIISNTNNGTISNVLVNVTVLETVNLRNNTIAGVVFDNKGTLTNCYTVTNGNEILLTAVKGASDSCVLYSTWAEVTEADLTALGALWRKEGEVTYFAYTVVYDATVRETVEDVIFADANSVATLTNAAFTVGSKWTVSVNGVEASVVPTEEGKLAVAIDPANLVSGYKATIIVKDGTQELSYSNVVVPTYINSAEELVALAVGGKEGSGYHQNSNTSGNDVVGYYVLAQDIDFATYTANDGIVAGGYCYQKSFFKGVLDGNGKTIKNIKVGSGGIFGGMKDATVKNVNFTDVTYLDNNSKDGFHGNYTALFASYSSGCTFSDITITVKAGHTRANNYDYIDGLFISMAQENTKYINISVDAGEKNLLTVLGSRVIASTTYENVTIKAGGYEAIGYNDSKSAYKTNTSVKLTEWPAGVTYTNASRNVPNAINSMSGNIAYYEGDVTALGFAAGSHVYEVTTTNLWNDRIVIPADESYDYVEFDIVFTTTTGNATAWPSPGSGTFGSLGIYVKGAVISADANSKPRTVQVFKANGDMFAAQSGDAFAANTKYTIRIGFNKGEGVMNFNFGVGTNQTYYITNSRFGNYDERVYVCGTGALHAYYEGDVTAFGFVADTKVSAVTITDGWSNRVRVNTDVKYDYVDITFATDKALPSLCIWAYGINGSILPGNYSGTATGIVPNTDSDPSKVAEARTIAVTDLAGNAVSTMEANTVYKLRIYLNDNTSSVAVSTFNAKADNPITFYFGAVSYGYEAR